MDLLNILERSNIWLSKFLDLNEKFLLVVEKDDFSTLDEFERMRNAILNTLDIYDRKVTELVGKLSPEEKTQRLSEEVRKILNRKAELIHSILFTDQKIVSKIEEEKTKLQCDLAVSNKSSHFSKKFKSGWVSESGEKLDGKI